jgi:hypothetical protein
MIRVEFFTGWESCRQGIDGSSCLVSGGRTLIEVGSVLGTASRKENIASLDLGHGLRCVHTLVKGEGKKYFEGVSLGEKIMLCCIWVASRTPPAAGEVRLTFTGERNHFTS